MNGCAAAAGPHEPRPQRRRQMRTTSTSTAPFLRDEGEALSSFGGVELNLKANGAGWGRVAGLVAAAGRSTAAVGVVRACHTGARRRSRRRTSNMVPLNVTVRPWLYQPFASGCGSGCRGPRRPVASSRSSVRNDPAPRVAGFIAARPGDRCGTGVLIRSSCRTCRLSMPDTVIRCPGRRR